MMRAWIQLLTLISIAGIVEPNISVGVKATKDTSIINGDFEHWNAGSFTSLFVGQDTTGFRGTWRTLLYFPLKGLKQYGKLAKATLLLSIDRARVGDYVPCTASSSSDPSVGCATVHVLTTAWMEGKGFRPAVDNETSWLFYDRPHAWETPGGDFIDTPIGQRSAEGDAAAEFALNISTLQNIINNIGGEGNNSIFSGSDDSLYQGFLIRDDDNTGMVDFDSRECALLSSGSADSSLCSSQRQAPQLVLEFESEFESSTVTTTGPTNGNNGGSTDFTGGGQVPSSQLQANNDSSSDEHTFSTTQVVGALVGVGVGSALWGLLLGLWIAARRQKQQPQRSSIRDSRTDSNSGVIDATEAAAIEPSKAFSASVPRHVGANSDQRDRRFSMVSSLHFDKDDDSDRSFAA